MIDFDVNFLFNKNTLAGELQKLIKIKIVNINMCHVVYIPYLV